jgi:hypothetical protein
LPSPVPALQIAGSACDFETHASGSANRRVGVTLRLQRVNGVVRSASGPGQYMLWQIAH